MLLQEGRKVVITLLLQLRDGKLTLHKESIENEAFCTFTGLVSQGQRCPVWTDEKVLLHYKPASIPLEPSGKIKVIPEQSPACGTKEIDWRQKDERDASHFAQDCILVVKNPNGESIRIKFNDFIAITSRG